MTARNPSTNAQIRTIREVLIAMGRTPPPATDPRPVPAKAALDHPHLYFNRELSWLDFFWRVLAQALDERTPLLERVRFLGFTAGHLDEFFSKRVGGLKRQQLAGVRSLSPDGRTPQQQLERIREAALPLYQAMTTVWEQHLKERLRVDAGVCVHDHADLSAGQQQMLQAYFREHVFPILTPLAVDPGHPFPFISNQSLSLAVMLRHSGRGTQHFARIKVPTRRQRWVPLGDPLHVVPLEQVIVHNLDVLFRGMEVVGVHVFRITRNADVSRDEEEADDLTAMISDELRERRFAPVVRIEVERTMPDRVRDLLMRELALEKEDLYEAGQLIDFTDCLTLADLDLPAHRYAPWEPVLPASLRSQAQDEAPVDLFAAIRRGDLLVHHPYESFRGTVQRFVEAAAQDPHVLAIKQTLYRTSEESPIMTALIRAAEAGKQVAVLVEVKARFDEQQNIDWGHRLEKSGVHVTYGLLGLKTHAKVTLVVREEEGGLRAYCHIGTGNYNATTAQQYTDLGLFTCHPDLGYDIATFFHYLTGYAPTQEYHTLIVAPRTMREAFVALIRREVAHQRQHGTGRIIAKMNGLDDVVMIRELYAAAQAGVRIDLIIRGACRLRPGLDGFSPTIRVVSIVGRFLENSRLYYFYDNGDPDVYIGSADWMRRNLEDRVETVVPIREAALKDRLDNLLQRMVDDTSLAWDLHADGQYVRRQPEADDEADGLHDRLMRLVQEEIAREPGA